MNDEAIRLVKSSTDCSGCGACMAVCPKQAITMRPGENGCLYPVIDEGNCVHCGKCQHICEYAGGTAGGNLPRSVYAAAGKDADLVRNSASGGVFATLAKSWIQAGGMVAGAVMDCGGGVKVYHVLSDKPEDVRRMQGSKYVQSDAWRCYVDVQAALKDGKRVLFSGTPCQTAAIRALTGDPEHLITVELICHGVPPQTMLDEYVRILSKRFGGKLMDFTFREKRVPKSFCARMDIQKGKRVRSLYLRSHELSFYKHFLEGTIYRENCYSCPYAKQERGSDLTIGDYWGVEKYHQDDFASGAMEKRSDWSCILVGSAKGEALLKQHGGTMTVHPSRLEWAMAENHQLRHPMQKPASRSEVLHLYQTGGYSAVENSFIHKHGGRLRYFLRVMKQLRRNRSLIKDE